MTERASQNPGRRRGSVLLSAVLVVVMVAVFAGTFGGWVARAAVGGVLEEESCAALYLAESGLELALREVVAETDLDGDGGIGSISDDGDPENDPELGAGRLQVARSGDGPYLLTATGRLGEARRVLRIEYEE